MLSLWNGSGFSVFFALRVGRFAAFYTGILFLPGMNTWFSIFNRSVFLILGICVFSVRGFAVSVSSSSLLWTSLGLNYDYLEDQQTGSASGDIVGDGENYGFFTVYNPGPNPTSGELGFRVRLDAAGGHPTNPVFDRVLWIGIDAGEDSSNDLDAFLGVDFQGGSNELTIRTAGNGANVSPNTTTVSNVPSFSYIPSSINYDYRMVDYLTDGGTMNDVTPRTSDDPDYYVSFMMPFADIVNFLLSQGISVDNSTPVRYVMATSTQPNSLNQDLGGVDGRVTTVTTWAELGGYTPNISFDGDFVVPEPDVSMMLGSIGVIPLLRRRR